MISNWLPDLHSAIVRSSPAVARVNPSGLTATADSGAVWPARTAVLERPDLRRGGDDGAPGVCENQVLEVLDRVGRLQATCEQSSPFELSGWRRRGLPCGADDFREQPKRYLFLLLGTSRPSGDPAGEQQDGRSPRAARSLGREPQRRHDARRVALREQQQGAAKLGERFERDLLQQGQHGRALGGVLPIARERPRRAEPVLGFPEATAVQGDPPLEREGVDG